ncbi:hypothetical protein ACIQPR_34000 [Streptomyces sp. NPDC091280]|uniref:Rv1733c family protein n=1 Tax=Streptomyces sp. NPDC091280 TaxID=3365984 RepID=UPI00381D49D9
MRKNRLVKVLGWRLRRNELRRHSDLVEAWIVLAAWSLATAGGVFAGVTGAHSMDAAQARDRAERRPVTATLVDIAPGGARDVTTGAAYGQVKGEVRWSDAHGTVRTGTTVVKAGTGVGGEVRVWTDGHGHLTSPPATRAVATARVVMTGTGAGLAGGLIVLGGGRLVRLRVERRATDRWDEEWERTAERWRRTTG